MQAEAVPDIGDAAMSEPDQMLGDLPRAGRVVDADVKTELTGMLIVDQYDGAFNSWSIGR